MESLRSIIQELYEEHRIYDLDVREIIEHRVRVAIEEKNIAKLYGYGGAVYFKPDYPGEMCAESAAAMKNIMKAIEPAVRLFIGDEVNEGTGELEELNRIEEEVDALLANTDVWAREGIKAFAMCDILENGKIVMLGHALALPPISAECMEEMTKACGLWDYVEKEVAKRNK